MDPHARGTACQMGGAVSAERPVVYFFYRFLRGRPAPCQLLLPAQAGCGSDGLRYMPLQAPCCGFPSSSGWECASATNGTVYRPLRITRCWPHRYAWPSWRLRDPQVEGIREGSEVIGGEQMKKIMLVEDEKKFGAFYRIGAAA